MNKLKRIYIFIIGVLIVTSCEDNDIPTIGDDYPTLVQFSNNNLTLATPEGGGAVNVEVTVSNKSSVDRVVNVAIDTVSTAINSQFNLGNLIIPANSYSGNLEISGNFDALPESGSTNLVLQIVDIENEESEVIENGKLKVELFRRCSIELTDLVGKWQGVDAWGYATEFETYMKDGDLMMKGGILYGWLDDYWGEPIIAEAPVKLDINLETFKVSISEQYYVSTTYNGKPQPDYKLAGSGEIINSCERIMDISPILIQPELTITGSKYGDEFYVRLKMINE
ncbi:hypothetical protein [Zunongwangia sp.]|uniref:hypothetical protein n=1 Tax=Zunongwangia sp. TaxID=1965325 RepID=UPI003AA91C9F